MHFSLLVCTTYTHKRNNVFYFVRKERRKISFGCTKYLQTYTHIYTKLTNCTNNNNVNQVKTAKPPEDPKKEEKAEEKKRDAFLKDKIEKEEMKEKQ